MSLKVDFRRTLSLTSVQLTNTILVHWRAPSQFKKPFKKFVADGGEYVFALQKGNVLDREQVEINQPIDPTYRAQIGLR